MARIATITDLQRSPRQEPNSNGSFQSRAATPRQIRGRGSDPNPGQAIVTYGNSDNTFEEHRTSSINLGGLGWTRGVPVAGYLSAARETHREGDIRTTRDGRRRYVTRRGGSEQSHRINGGVYTGIPGTPATVGIGFSDDYFHGERTASNEESEERGPHLRERPQRTMTATPAARNHWQNAGRGQRLGTR